MLRQVGPGCFRLYLVRSRYDRFCQVRIGYDMLDHARSCEIMICKVF
jgi:hypothetical protein